MDLRSKVAMVTGAGKRVGRAIALELAAGGCDVVVHYHQSGAAADETAEAIGKLGRRAAVVQADLADPHSAERLVDAAISAMGRLDVLVNNASLFVPTPAESDSPVEWTRTFQVNAITPGLLARRAAVVMKNAGAGRIINIVDILADRPIRRYAAYCASKAALASLTRSLARELAPAITVNGVSPGIAIFPEHYPQALREELIARVPLQRAGEPQDIAAMVRFLAERGDYITGQIIPVDGGRSIVP